MYPVIPTVNSAGTLLAKIGTSIYNGAATTVELVCRCWCKFIRFLKSSWNWFVPHLYLPASWMVFLERPEGVPESIAGSKANSAADEIHQSKESAQLTRQPEVVVLTDEQPGVVVLIDEQPEVVVPTEKQPAGEFPVNAALEPPPGEKEPLPQDEDPSPSPISDVPPRLPLDSDKILSHPTPYIPPEELDAVLRPLQACGLGAGIERIGMLCYLIAAVQAAYRNPVFMNAVLIAAKLGLGDDAAGRDVVKYLAEIFNYFNNPIGMGAIPRPCSGELAQKFHRAVGKKYPLFADGGQHDAMEFFTSFVDIIRKVFEAFTPDAANALVEEAKLKCRVTPPEIDLLYWIGFYRPDMPGRKCIAADFGDFACGRVHSQVIDSDGNPLWATSNTDNHYGMLALPMAEKTKNFQDAIDLFCLDELMTGDNGMHFAGINAVLPCTKSEKLLPLPPFFTVQLKRFIQSCDAHGKAELRKNNSELLLPERFIPEGRNFVHGGDKCYDLRYAVCHSGDLNGGHYVIYVKFNDIWYCFNGASVTQLPNFRIEDLNRNAILIGFESDTRGCPPPSRYFEWKSSLIVDPPS
jgi:ubiquitin C-terminal hydrolase